METLDDRPCLPAILQGDDILVPIKIDLTASGLRYVDTFTWNLFNSALTPLEFAAKTCGDLNLPFDFTLRFAQQLTEQVASYADLVTTLQSHLTAQQPASSALARAWQDLSSQHICIQVGLRHGAVDYNEDLLYSLQVASPPTIPTNVPLPIHPSPQCRKPYP